MAALTAGGSDWSSSTITAIRIDPVHVSGDVWKSIGSRSDRALSAWRQTTSRRSRLPPIPAQANSTGLKATYLIKVQAGDIVGGLILGAEAAAGGSTTIGNGRSIKHLLDCAARRAGRHENSAVRPLHHTDNDQRRGNACRHLHERGIHPLRRHQRSALRPRHRQQDQRLSMPTW